VAKRLLVLANVQFCHIHVDLSFMLSTVGAEDASEIGVDVRAALILLDGPALGSTLMVSVALYKFPHISHGSHSPRV
jgi:hypothetical protein